MTYLSEFLSGVFYETFHDEIKLEVRFKRCQKEMSEDFFK
jgi:hypothetical protein